MRSAPCWRPHYWALTVPDRPTPNFLHHHSRVREATDGAKAEMSRLSARRVALGNELASAPFWPVLVLLLSHHGYGQMRENRLEILIDQPSQVVGRTVDYLARVGMVNVTLENGQRSLELTDPGLDQVSDLLAQINRRDRELLQKPSPRGHWWTDLAITAACVTVMIALIVPPLLG